MCEKHFNLLTVFLRLFILRSELPIWHSVPNSNITLHYICNGDEIMPLSASKGFKYSVSLAKDVQYYKKQSLI